jgi:hypothetical protein
VIKQGAEGSTERIKWLIKFETAQAVPNSDILKKEKSAVSFRLPSGCQAAG